MAEPDEVAGRVVKAGGSGDADDVAAVQREAARLPLSVLQFFETNSIPIVACRGNVTDYAVQLRNDHPRGWPPGQTWTIVPGVFLPEPGEVVIATVDRGAGRIVPPTNDMHGSFALVLHESMHGNDFFHGHRLLNSAPFTAARNADFNKLDAYERQGGEAGPQETYAESAARYFGGDARLSVDWPNLNAFWRGVPVGNIEAVPLAVLPRRTIEAKFIGVGERQGDRIRLDLRAEGLGGAIGHALFEVGPHDPAYAAFAPQFSAPESAHQTKVLLRPLD